MTNRFGVALHPDDLRWAAAEGVSETVIAAVVLLHESTVDEIAPKLKQDELAQVINLVGRCPSCYPAGTHAALKNRRQASSHRSASESCTTKQGLNGLPCSVTTTPTQEAGKHRSASESCTTKQGLNGLPCSVTTTPTQEAGKRADGTDSQKSGTLPGTLAETVRRRMVVEDLMELGLSVRAMSAGTGIPRSAVHRAMRAMAKAKAKREVAVVEIMDRLLGKRLDH
jgi:hypothetical protein